MFRAGLLLIIRIYYSVRVYTAISICHAFILTGCWQDPANSILLVLIVGIYHDARSTEHWRIIIPV